MNGPWSICSKTDVGDNPIRIEVTDAFRSVPLHALGAQDLRKQFGGLDIVHIGDDTLLLKHYKCYRPR